MNDSYHSILEEATATFRDKASKFIAFACPVSSEDEVRDKLLRLRKEYHDANHHCFAYRLGPAGTIYRISDDGEPSGSAGRPILGQLISFDLSDLLLVVVRYFGGTKLGIPGLIIAYRSAARLALEKSEVCEKFVESKMRVAFPFENMDAVMKILKSSGAIIDSRDINQNCVLELRVRKGISGVVMERLSKASKSIRFEES
jgi:uncharacterized YigZ family protein